MLASLPSVTVQTLGKEAILVPESIDFRHVSLFAECIFMALDKEAILVPECTEFCHVYTLPSVLTLELDKRPLSCHK